MVDLLWRFLAKCRAWFIVGLILASLGGLFCIAVNQIVKRFVPSLATLTADRLKLKVSFQKVHYSFPREVILEGLTVSSSQTPSKLMINAPRLVLDFAIPIFPQRGKIHLKQVSLDQAVMDIPTIKDYLEHQGNLFWDVIKTLPVSEMNLSSTSTKVYLFKRNKIVAPLAVDINFKLDKSGQFAGQLKDNYSFLQYWGTWQDNRVIWKGFMFYKGPFVKEPLYVLDIEGLAFVKSPDVWLKKLSFSINGDQFLATGHGLLGTPFKFEFHILYRKQLKHISLQDPLENVEATLTGQINRYGLLVSGHTYLDLLFSNQLNMFLQNINLEFKDLQTAIINDRLLQLKTPKTQISLTLNNKTYKIAFDHFLAGIKRGPKAQWIASLSTKLYGGSYKGQMLLDTDRQPWQFQVNGKIEHIEMARLSDLSKYFTKCKGDISGSFEAQIPHNLSLRANLALHDGDLSDFDFLPVAASKLFQMPSLDHLSNADLFMHLKLDPASANIQYFKLHSNNVNLQGSFRLDSNNLVFSRISMLFPKEVLNESPIGQKVMQLVPEAWQLPFVFHLSGDVQRMNFQWDDSPLKRKIEERLPHFVERSIQQRVDEKVAI